MALEVDIKKAFPGFTLDVSFQADKGCMGILGASGCGKSMTLKCIAGIEKPDEGRIVLNGRVLFDSKKRIDLKPQKRNVGYLFQNYALFPNMTVEENIGIGMKLKKEEKKPLTAKQLELFQLQGLEKRYPYELSGGQQQRVALARILSCNPDIIMLDEPFSALDGYLKDTLQLQMQEVLAGYGKDVLFVSHSRDEIFKFCDKMCLISQGKSMQVGDTKEIFSKPGTMEAAKLTGCKNLSAIEKISDYELFAKDWNFRMKTAEKIGDDIRYVGVRGHWLIPSWTDQEENTMAIKEAGYTETPFEKQYLFVNALGEGNSRIWWMINKKDFIDQDGGGLPPYMIFPKEHIMLLR